MDAAFLLHQLETNPSRIQRLVEGIAPEQARWRPGEGAWSMLEVVNHLYDEEMYDFRVRLDTVLHHPGEDPPPIDPQGWVTARGYNERELEPSVQGYLAERRKSLAWLRGLDEPNWDAVYTAAWGTIRAGDIFAAWAAHDLLHMRQLVELHYACTARAGAPYSIEYAGEW